MPYYLIVIIISFIGSLICLSNNENRVAPLLFFPVFLCLSVLVEYYGTILAEKNVNTQALYNFFTVFEFVFYLVFFYFIFPASGTKRATLVVAVLYFVIAALNIFLYQGIDSFHTYTYMLGSLIIVTFSILYFNLLFRRPDSGRLTVNPYFWIVTGLMFFETCTFTFYGLNNFIASTMRQYNWVLRFVSDFLNVSLYTLFTIGFLCKINIRKFLGLS